MKVAFDEHVPVAIAKVFSALAKERGIRRLSDGLIFETARQYAPKTNEPGYGSKTDIPWLDRFAAAGGKAIISGDVKMRENPHEKLALLGHGFVVIFFERQCARWSFLRKTALMLHWWEQIAEKLRTADAGTFWVIPAMWPPHGGELKNVSSGLLQLLKDNPKRAAKPKKPKKFAERKRKDISIGGLQPNFLSEVEPHE